MAGSVSSYAVWPNYSEVNVRKAASSSNVLGKDQFLELLVAQLKHQDPMNPMDNTQFIAQTAQFTSVEQLMNMSQELTLMRQNIGSASSLIGKTVEWNEYDNAGNIVLKNGVVEAIISKDGNLHARVNGQDIGLEFIGSISATVPTPSGDEQSDSTEASEGSNEVVTP